MKIPNNSLIDNTELARRNLLRSFFSDPTIKAFQVKGVRIKVLLSDVILCTNCKDKGYAPMNIDELKTLERTPCPYCLKGVECKRRMESDLEYITANTKF